mmetsp:Transcript_3736/g.9332  ORF Transcript_3736/g.9332 Transcript_3736/m.9332 type:complete len:93 (+) Transcript_3736:1998-2276(+)
MMRPPHVCARVAIIACPAVQTDRQTHTNAERGHTGKGGPYSDTDTTPIDKSYSPSHHCPPPSLCKYPHTQTVTLAQRIPIAGSRWQNVSVMG